MNPSFLVQPRPFRSILAPFESNGDDRKTVYVSGLAADGARTGRP